MLERPISVRYGDGWHTEIAEREDGSLSVLVASPQGRSWGTWRATIDEAVEVARLILSDQRGAGEAGPLERSAASDLPHQAVAASAEGSSPS